MSPENELKMPFWGHLTELRSRLLKSLIGIGVGFAVAYFFSDELFRLLRQPFDQAYRDAFGREPHMVYTTLFEPFTVFLKLGLVGGCFLATPYIFYQVWCFVAPGLKASERKHGLRFVTIATALFVGGALFGYFGVFPIGFRYFLEVGGKEYFQPMIRMEDYYQLTVWTMLVFGLVFEAPLLVLYLVYFGLIPAEALTRNWRGILVGIFVAAAVLTPADVGSMLMMAFPMCLLYLATMIVARQMRTNRGTHK